MEKLKRAKYEPLPELAPYIRTDRYENPKETFKQALAKVVEMVDVTEELSLIDVGCANGEFLYYIKKMYPHWHLTGFDPTPAFIECGKKIAWLEGVTLEVMDLAHAARKGRRYDVVVCVGTFQIFADLEESLQYLLDLCTDDGVIVCDSLFNKYDVEVRTLFCDNSTPEAAGVWRSDYHWHSQKKVREYLNGKVKSVDFQDVVMIDLPFNPKAPHINEFTFKDANGRNFITNGLNMIVNPTIMAIQR